MGHNIAKIGTSVSTATTTRCHHGIPLEDPCVECNIAADFPSIPGMSPIEDRIEQRRARFDASLRMGSERHFWEMAFCGLLARYGIGGTPEEISGFTDKALIEWRKRWATDAPK